MFASPSSLLSGNIRQRLRAREIWVYEPLKSRAVLSPVETRVRIGLCWCSLKLRGVLTFKREGCGGGLPAGGSSLNSVHCYQWDNQWRMQI